jgi:hypothetical protein
MAILCCEAKNSLRGTASKNLFAMTLYVIGSFFPARDRVKYAHLIAECHKKVVTIIFYFARAVSHATVQTDRLCYI